MRLPQIFDYIVRYHHDQLRLNGYHDFTRATKAHKSIPLTIVSLWNTAILATAAGIHHYYRENFFEKCVESYMSPVVYITAFNVVETLIFLVVHSSYISRVVKFNTVQMPPDALQGLNTVTGSVGLVQRGADVNELLEKQGKRKKAKMEICGTNFYLLPTFPADLIDYLRNHNANLNQKVIKTFPKSKIVVRDHFGGNSTFVIAERHMNNSPFRSSSCKL